MRIFPERRLSPKLRLPRYSGSRFSACLRILNGTIRQLVEQQGLMQNVFSASWIAFRAHHSGDRGAEPHHVRPRNSRPSRCNFLGWLVGSMLAATAACGGLEICRHAGRALTRRADVLRPRNSGQCACACQTDDRARARAVQLSTHFRRGARAGLANRASDSSPPATESLSTCKQSQIDF